MPHVLIVDDNASVRQALSLALAVEGFDTAEADTPAAALAAVETHCPDLVIQDMNFSADTTSGSEGVALFHALRACAPTLPIVLLTAWTQLDTAVTLMRDGAADYLAKPWDDERLLETVRAACSGADTAGSRETATAGARQTLAGRFDLCGLVYASPAMHEVVRLACRVAAADAPVLISGPSGVGKEKLAEIIHRNSAVAGGPLIQLNVGALPSDLVAAELFGVEAGAFTGAAKARAGRFEAADGGTLFLDEIATLPSDDQVKLLRVLQSGDYQRLGSVRDRRASARIVSATNANLEQAIASGTFRDDLYYRLNVVEIRVPPLRERREDVAVLARHFLDDQHTLGDAALTRLCGHSWPGNVRELENCVRRACLLSDSAEITPDALHLRSATQAAAKLDATAIQQALAGHQGVVSAAAKALGISRQALYRRMDKLGLRPDA